jgi:hypothetical protein
VLSSARKYTKNLHVSTRNVRDISRFSVCASNKDRPFSRCAFVANMVGKDLDIFEIGAVSVSHIL